MFEGDLKAGHAHTGPKNRRKADQNSGITDGKRGKYSELASAMARLESKKKTWERRPTLPQGDGRVERTGKTVFPLHEAIHKSGEQGETEGQNRPPTGHP